MGQGGDGGIAAHHLLVREHVGAADVEGTAHLGRHGGTADEVAQDVADGDGLDAGADPAGGDHDGEPFGQVAQHFEGGRAGADDDGGAQDSARHPGAEEDLTDLGAGAQVRGQVADRDPRRGEPAEVDDAPDAGRTGLFGEDAGSGAVAVLESGSGAEGVDEVVGDVDAVQGRCDGLGVGDIAADDLGAPGPRVVAQLLGGPGQAPDAVSGLQELGHQAASDVTGGSGDQAVQTGGGLHRSLLSSDVSARQFRKGFGRTGACGCTATGSRRTGPLVQSCHGGGRARHPDPAPADRAAAHQRPRVRPAPRSRARHPAGPA